MSIRIAAPGDESRIAMLAGQLGYPCGAEEVRGRLEHLLSDPAHRVYVAVLPETGVVGWMHIFIHQVVESDPRVEVAALVVDETKGRTTSTRLWAIRS